MNTSFHFRAVTAGGEVRSGTRAAENSMHLAHLLRSEGLVPVHVGERAERFRFSAERLLPQRRRGLLAFTEEMATLLASRVAIDRALAICQGVAADAGTKEMVQDVLRLVRSGKSVAASMESQKGYFPDLYINMVRAGEASGSLAQIFERLAELERTRDELRNYVVSALLYPALLTVAGSVSVAILLCYVLPRFAAVFQSSHVAEPMSMQVLLGFGALLSHYGWLAALVLIAAIVTLKRTVPWDSVLLQLPGLGAVLRSVETARFSRCMGTLIASGVPLIESMRLGASTVRNRRMARALERASQSTKRGEGIAGPLRRCGELPNMASELLQVGEETGHVAPAFLRIAAIYENASRTSLKRFVTLFEPILILVMGILVGAVVLTVLNAITSINDVTGL